MEAGVLADEGGEEAVAHEGDQVKDEKEGEEQSVGPGVGGEAQENELCRGGPVEVLHCDLPV